MLNDASQAVSVSGNDDLLAFLQLRNDDVIPVGQCSLDGELQRLEHGELVLAGSILVDVVFNDGFVELVIGLHGGWWSVERAAPDLNLLLAVLLGSLGLVHAGQPTVMSLIQAPCLLDWNSCLSGFLQDRIELKSVKVSSDESVFV